MKNIAKLGAILREWWKSGEILTDPANPTIFDHPWIKEYMNRLFQEKKEADARLEKIIATAIVKISMSKMGMNKEEALLRNSSKKEKSPSMVMKCTIVSFILLG